MSINASFTLPLLVSRTQVLSNTVRPRARPRAPRAAPAGAARPLCAPTDYGMCAVPPTAHRHSCRSWAGCAVRG